VNRMLHIAFAAAALAMSTWSTGALACSPAPSCWIDEGPSYLRSVCKGYAKDGKTLGQIASYLDEPEKITEFDRACRRVGVHLKRD